VRYLTAVPEEKRKDTEVEPDITTPEFQGAAFALAETLVGIRPESSVKDGVPDMERIEELNRERADRIRRKLPQVRGFFAAVKIHSGCTRSGSFGCEPVCC
jgi:hypothetical protein